MACFYEVVQDNRKGGSKLFYGRARFLGTTDLDAIADRIQHTASVTKGDVLAVLTELVVIMKDEMQSGRKVKIDGLGSFCIGMRSTGTVTEEAYDIKKNNKGAHINFVAEYNRSNNVTTREFTEGLTWSKIENLDKTKKESTGA